MTFGYIFAYQHFVELALSGLPVEVLPLDDVWVLGLEGRVWRDEELPPGLGVVFGDGAHNRKHFGGRKPDGSGDLPSVHVRVLCEEVQL